MFLTSSLNGEEINRYPTGMFKEKCKEEKPGHFTLANN